MKRGLIKFVCLVICLIAISLFLSSATYSEDAITSKAVTGETTALTQAIVLVNTGPVITINSPKEGRTYRNVFILLNYSLVDPDGVSLAWYNLDGINISLGNSTRNYIYFNTTEGNKTLYLYSNDSGGLLGHSLVNFYVNNTKLIIIYETFRTSSKGSSNNFDSYTESQLENFPNMTLENINYGKIIWNENINLTGDINPSDKITTLDYDVLISNQSIFVNTTKLPNLNKSAALWFYNLNYTNPRILINGKICPITICSNKTYSNGILSFVVTSFFNFTLEETPTKKGGGGAAETPKEEIMCSYDPESIKISLLQGQKSEVEMHFQSFDKRDINFNLSLEVPGASLSENNFVLKKGEKNKISVLFNAQPEPGIYSGYLTIEARTTDNVNITKKVQIVFVINSEHRLFDVSLTVLPEYKKIFAGQPVYSQIDLYNMGLTKEPIDVKLIYEIQEVRDYNGNVIAASSESIAVQTKISTVRRLIVPQSTKPGEYLFTVNVSYDGSSAFSSDSFLVEKSTNLTWLYLLLALLILILAVLYFIREKRNKKF